GQADHPNASAPGSPAIRQRAQRTHHRWQREEIARSPGLTKSCRSKRQRQRIEKEMKVVASFTRLSPSRMTMIRRGTAKLRVTDNAATASGGEIIAPKTKPTANGSAVKSWNKYAVAVIVNRTSTIAKSRIGRRFPRKSRQDVQTAAG